MLSRIMIVGGPGAGKTRLAGILGDRLGLPVFSVDESVWDKDGKVRPNAEIDAAMQELAARDRWIIEGGNTRTYAERERRADLVICLRPPVWLRLCRVLRRRGVSIDLLRWTIRYDAVFGRDWLRGSRENGRSFGRRLICNATLTGFDAGQSHHGIRQYRARTAPAYIAVS